MKKLGLLVMPLMAITLLASCGGSNPEPTDADSSIYRLQFNDSGNLGKNTAKNSKFKNASIIGNDMHVVGKHKNSSILQFGNQDHNTNYLNLPIDVLKNDNTTIAMWLRMPKVGSDDSNRPLFGISFNGGYFYACPYDEDTWNSFALHSKFSGEEVNLTKVKPSDKVYHSLAPLEGTLQPILGGWQLIGFSFTTGGLQVYQNGKLALSYSGDYSLKGKSLESFKIGSATEANGRDFNASISDVRIYDHALNEDDYKAEFSTIYTDYNTIDMDFNNKTLNDSARNYNGMVLDAAKDNVSFTQKDNRDAIYLNGEGGTDSSERSGFYLPKGAIMGHTEMTISMDIYVEPRKNQDYKGMRLFDFSSNDDDKAGGGRGKRFLGFYYTRYDLNRIRVGTITDKDRFESETNPDSWVSNPDFSLPIRKWMNITSVFSKGKTKILMNGEIICEGENSPWYSSLFYDFNNCDFFVGRPNQGGSFGLHSYLDNFKIYATALNDTEIQDMTGNIHTESDAEAVQKAMDNFDIKQCTRSGNGRIYLSHHLDDGVLASIVPQTPNIIDEEGYLLFTNEVQECPIKVTLSRNGTSLSKNLTLIIPKNTQPEKVVENNDFTKETYNSGSYQWNMQEKTFNWMRDLSNDKLTYMYKISSGEIPLAQFDANNSYGSWIRPGCGGEGQFQAEYIGALARATNYTEYSDVSELRTKLSNLLATLQECQTKYGETFPDEIGYLNGFSHLCFDELVKGKDRVIKSEYGDKLLLPFDETVWVPFYMYHKQLMMCYDIMTYANMGDDATTASIKAQAESMFLLAANWVKERVLNYNVKEREMALRIEYGGMAEAMYAAYRVSLENNEIDEAKDYLRAARFFEEDFFLEAIHEDSNLLPGIHVNTAIPKFIGCCAAYESTGDTFYLEAAQKAWDMMVNHMTMSNGGISSIGEHYEEPDHATQARFGEETCCSYNMLRLTDYLYRFTGDVKYMHYFEQVFYNHILPSIDMVGSNWASDDWPYSDDPKNHQTYYDELQLAGKAYVMSTDFGHHITYSSNDDSFWCCVATGTESYTKLSFGNFYLDKNKEVYVNMYNNIKYRVNDTISLSISGIKAGTVSKGSETVEITAEDGSVDLSKYHLIIPTWVNGDINMTVDGQSVTYTTAYGYMVANTTLNQGETLVITLPMKLNVVSQRGYKESEGLGKYSYTLYYGPYMLVPDLGTFEMPTNPGDTSTTGDIYIHNNHGSDQQGQHSYEDAYKIKHSGSTEGMISQLIKFDGTSYNDKISKNLENVEIKDGHAYNSGLRFDFVTTNNGTLKFRPFMDINYERYSFYMYYNVEFNE